MRGKTGTDVEFGAKFGISYVTDFIFLDHLSWDNFNESEVLIAQLESF